LQPSKPKRKIELVIFDCDGVLVDSELLSAQMVIEVFAEIGVSVDLPFVYKNFVGHSFTTVAANYARKHGRQVPDNFVDEYRRRLLESFEGNLKPMAGIESVLTKLNVPICVATGSSPARVAKSLAVTGLAERFGGNVFSTSLVERGKPHPDIFLYAAKAIGVDPEACLVIEDSTAGVNGAKAAGMTTWHFTGGVHFNHGYQHVSPPLLVDRKFDRMSDFFDAAPELRCKSES
jgi:HAD superfamily hydrolase (TIGR01509 family)